jgi:hypothetical protein
MLARGERLHVHSVSQFRQTAVFPAARDSANTRTVTGWRGSTSYYNSRLNLMFCLPALRSFFNSQGSFKFPISQHSIY